MHRVITFLSVFLISTSVLISQDLPSVSGKDAFLKQGDMAYKNGEYNRAIGFFNSFLELSPDQIDVIVKVGNCHLYLNELKEAEFYYEQAFQKGGTTKESEYFYNYGNLLITLGNRDKARLLLNRYGKVEGMERVQDQITSIDNYANFFSDSLAYSVSPVWFNTPESDNSPSLFKEGLLFLSALDPEIFQRKRKSKSVGYLKTFYSEMGEKRSAIKKFDLLGKSKSHEGSIVFFDNDNQAYLTRTTPSSRKNVFRRMLYHATFDSTKRQANMKALPFNSLKYSVGQPATNEDGTVLVFSSNMPGGYGGSDLYISNKKNGKWTNPMNLGEKINTSGDEIFPFLTNSNVLYFSSNGHIGLGGLDIYRTTLESGNQMVKNPGYPMNSSYDDHGLVINDRGSNGYFSSNRLNGVGSDDIYAFEVFLIQVTSRLVSEESGNFRMGDFKVIDLETGVKIPFDLDGDQINFKGIVGNSYQIEAKLDENNIFIKEVVLDSFTSETYLADINFYESELSRPITIQLEFIHKYTREEFKGPITIVDTNTGKSVPMKFGADSSNLVINGLSNRTYSILGQEEYFEQYEDSFSTNLNDESLENQQVKKYFTSKPDMSTGSKYENGIPVNLLVTSNGVQKSGFLQWGPQWLAISLDTLPDFVKKEWLFVENSVSMNTPQFDFNQAILNSTVKSQLDSLLAVLKNGYPELLLVGHSDSSGDSAYNLKLSQRRAENVASYLKSNGYPANKIRVEFFGEDQLLKACEDCTKEDNRINRRVEIILKTLDLWHSSDN